MISVKNIKEYLDQWAPESLALEWDNVGLQCGYLENKVKSVIISMDIDSVILSMINQVDLDCIITHHPLIFKPLTQLDLSTIEGKIIQACIKNKTTILSYHTNLDKTDGGVNDCLMKQFNASDGTCFKDGIGKWIEQEHPSSLTDWLNRFQVVYKKALTICPRVKTDYDNYKHHLRITGETIEKPIKRIAFCGGSGRSLLSELIENKIDLFITGELNYHDELWCEMQGITVFLMGHKESEVFVLPEIETRLIKQFGQEFTIKVI
mgnify:CR=1 FL=1